MTPGRSIADAVLRGGRGTATPCSRPGPNPEACPPAGPFTGSCVEANLVFGYTADDDMCTLPGAYYDANPDAPPGRECDLALLSPASTEPRQPAPAARRILEKSKLSIRGPSTRKVTRSPATPTGTAVPCTETPLISA